MEPSVWHQVIQLYPSLVECTTSSSPQVCKALKEALHEYKDLLAPPMPQNNQSWADVSRGGKSVGTEFQAWVICPFRFTLVTVMIVEKRKYLNGERGFEKKKKKKKKKKIKNPSIDLVRRWPCVCSDLNEFRPTQRLLWLRVKSLKAQVPTRSLKLRGVCLVFLGGWPVCTESNLRPVCHTK